METILVDIHHDSSKTIVINMDHLQTISPVQTGRNIFGQQLPTLLAKKRERSTLSFPGRFLITLAADLQ